MPRNLLTYLMAATITLHAMLGCCWHHAHAGEQGQTVAVHTECDHCHAGDDRGSPENPQKCRTDCAGVCTFLPTQKTQLDALPITAALDGVIVTDAILPTSIFSPINSNRQRSEPPLRLHLLHQLLLI